MKRNYKLNYAIAYRGWLVLGGNQGSQEGC